MNLIVAFLATVILEIPVIYAAFRRYRPRNIILNSILINGVTNLTLNLFRFVGLVYSTAILLCAEAIIVLVEIGMFYYCTRDVEIPMKRIILACLASNAFSFSVGFLFWGL